MVIAHDVEHATPRRDAKRAAIHAAAISEFSARGFAGTSMANIAETAGMSRPALYQYFPNKGEIFASAFVAIFDEQVDNALAALNGAGPTAERLDGFLQRYEGDLWERMAASAHIDEIMSAKNQQVADAVVGATARLWSGLASHLETARAGGRSTDSTRLDGWVEILRFAPKGFRFDQPSVETYRRRLTALARCVGAEIDAS